MTRETAAWAIVRVLKERPNVCFQTVDAKRQESESENRGVERLIKGVLAARITNPDGSLWGVVDFDAFTHQGYDRLATKAARVAVTGLASHLGLLFAFNVPGKATIGPNLSKKGGKPKCFIVHGRDETLKLDLKNYLQNSLALGEPVILHEQPSMGRTIIEKFEQEARNVDLVFVLLTPDDAMAKCTDDDSARRRARQNVIFEMGYFFAKLQRTTGRVVLLSKSKLELPSDISGLIYIDVSSGIEAAGETLRRELRPWLGKNW
jgi:predicted nucleotide-binding protein